MDPDIPQMTVWTVYKHPKDHPDAWVLRAWDMVGREPVAREQYVIAPTLDLLREHIPDGLVRISRSAADDPVIYESWI